MQLTKSDIERIKSAKDLIDADMTRHYSIEEIATYAGMSKTKLKVGFKLLEKTGLYHYLKLQRLNKGKYQIENTENTLKEISRSLGYTHVSNFITAFRKLYGRTPGFYRKGTVFMLFILFQYLLKFLFEQETLIS